MLALAGSIAAGRRHWTHRIVVLTGMLESARKDGTVDPHRAKAGTAYVRRAGNLYSWGLRHLILVAPILASLLHPFAGPVAALLVVVVLSGFDRFGAR